MMRWDFVSGFRQKVNDGSALWTLADMLRVPTDNRHEWDSDLRLMLNHLDGPRGIVVYSYGCAALFNAWKKMQDAGELSFVVDWLVIIAGVNRKGWKQSWSKCWEIPEHVDRAVCFSTVYRNSVPGRFPVVPECCPIRNPSSRYQNIPVFWDGVDHSNVVSLPIVRETLAAIGGVE
jgi:hypothetical protein